MANINRNQISWQEIDSDPQEQNIWNEYAKTMVISNKISLLSVMQISNVASRTALKFHDSNAITIPKCWINKLHDHQG